MPTRIYPVYGNRVWETKLNEKKLSLRCVSESTNFLAWSKHATAAFLSNNVINIFSLTSILSDGDRLINNREMFCQ